MKANQLHIDGINRELEGTGWIARRSRGNECSILVGHESIERCALITCAGYGSSDSTLTFVTVHEESAKSLSRVGFSGSVTFESGKYETFRFQYWNRLIRFLQDLSRVSFDLNDETVWEFADYVHEPC